MTTRDSDPGSFFSKLYHHPGLGLTLDTSRMRLPPAPDPALDAAFARAFEQMAALEAGAVANPDEGRQVGHYWLRAPHLAPDEATAAAIRAEQQCVAHFVQAVREGSTRPRRRALYSDVLCIGIGGSALGPQLLADALVAPAAGPGGDGLRLHFLDNTDPAGIDKVLAGLEPVFDSLLVLVTSKSGGTPETRNGMLEVQRAFAAAGADFAAQAVAVTCAGSRLDALAREQGWLARFHMQEWVGGRTSLFCSVGLLPAALAGIDTAALLDGAREMDEATRLPSLVANPAARLAHAWYDAGAGEGRRDMVVLPYKDSLLLFSRYLQQLVMESLGKGTDLDGRPVAQGIAVYGNKGSTDQHAYVQQLREGLDNFFVSFIEVLEGRSGASMEVEPDVTSADYLAGFLYGTREALSENGRRSLTISVPRVDARRLGALIALHERAVGLYASLVNINAYHQPGVEAGKRAAAERLGLQRALLAALRAAPGAERGLAEVAAAAGTDDLEAVFQLLRHLAANRAEVTLSGDPTSPQRLRARYDAAGE